MSFEWIPPPEPTTLTGKFGAITTALNDAVLGCAVPGGCLTHAMWSILNGWIFKHIVRIRLLIGALQAGTVRTRRSPPSGSTRRRAETGKPLPAFFLSRRFAWMLAMIRGRSLPNGALQTLLADPEMIALLTASPRLMRTMKPFCRALGVEMPKLPRPAPNPVPPDAGPEGGATPEVCAPGGHAGPNSTLPAANAAVASGAVARFAVGDARFRE